MKIVEELLIENFVKKERKQRYLKLLSTERGRKKLRQAIPHFEDLNPAYIYPVNNIRTSADLIAILNERSAPSKSYIISEHSEYDGKFFPLAAALDELFNSGISYFLCAIPEKLNYYEGEDTNSRYLLIK